MSVTYGKFQMPEKITADDIKSNAAKDCSLHARFVAEPFERGFGHTIGNSLRRMMLSSLEAPAIVSIMLEGASHEYMAMEGIIEDMTHIILNLKGALLRHADLESAQPRKITIVSKTLEITADDLGKERQYNVTLKDLIDHPLYELVNPDLHIFTVTKPMKKKVQLRVSTGRGYVPSERHDIEDKIVDEIVIDSAFSPVTLVNYFVENTRVGQDTDFDRLILDVKTDGRVTPKEALSFASQILVKHLDVFDEVEDRVIGFEEDMGVEDTDFDELMQKLALRINEIELSVRSTNCLNGAEIETIGELVVKPESEMLKFRNFGKKSLNEIKAKLSEMGLQLGMDLNRFGITVENVREKIQEYLDSKNVVEG